MDIENNEDLVAVYLAPDEASANIIAGLLQSEGIEALAIYAGTAWGTRYTTVDPAVELREKYWGDVVVKGADVIRSLELIEAYAPDESELNPQPVMATAGGSSCLIRGLLTFFAVLFGVSAYCSWTGHPVVMKFVCVYGSVMGCWVGQSSSGKRSMDRTPPQYRPALLQTAQTIQVVAFAFMLQFIGSYVYYLKPLVTGIGVAGALGLGYYGMRKIPLHNPTE